MNLIQVDSCTRSELIEELKTAIEEVVKDQFKNDQTSKTDLITRNETAKILGISLPTLNTWTKTGKIPAYRIGSRIRYKKQEVFDSLQKVSKYQKGVENA